jgi:RNA polymerase sigma factor for flagellar operon FliA
VSTSSPPASVHGRYRPLVQRIARKAAGGGLPHGLGLEDALSAGWLGLLSALKRRGEGMSEQCFEAFASFRIRGAILDQMRAFDPLSREQRRRSRQINRAIERLTAQLGRMPEPDEIAEAVDLPLGAFHELSAQLEARLPASSDAPEPSDLPSPELTVEAAIDRRKVVEAVEKSIQALPKRMALVLALHYQEDLSLREIGEVMNLTASRVCQLHKEALGLVQNNVRVLLARRAPRRVEH